MDVTREQFEAAWAAMESFGKAPGAVVADDFKDADHRSPYKLLTLKVDQVAPDACGVVAASLADLAIAHQGHLSMYTHGDYAAFALSVACDLANFEATL